MITALKRTPILLPAPKVDKTKWAIIACDQYTAQPEYWNKVEAIVGDAPSTLRLTLPEIYLNETAERLPAIHSAMNAYLDAGLLYEAVDGFILVERTTHSGVRPGLMAAIDLEQYDPNTKSLIRATEGTVASRVPPRARIRAGARLELPHVMMLIDDPNCTVIESLYDSRSTLRPLYDFELMMDGGTLRGWAVEDDAANRVIANMSRLSANCQGLLYAVGDGNHSLAAAKQCWVQIRDQLTERQRENHPARYALVELVNLHCPALTFEPIHRFVYGVNSVDLVAGFRSYLSAHGIPDVPGTALIAFAHDAILSFRIDQYPLPIIQGFLDQYLLTHPNAHIDYIHGEDARKKLVKKTPNSIGLMPRPFQKSELFSTIRRLGVLPRKAFSMGEADEKRFYMEARKIL